MWLGATRCYLRPGQREGMPYNVYEATDLGRAVASHLKENT